MKRNLIWLTASVAALGAGVAGAQSYPSSGYGYGDDNYGRTGTLRCESVDSRTKRCPTYGATDVRLAHQLSRKQCIQGRNWDHTRDEVWVTNGCRADFHLSMRDDRYGDGRRYGQDDRYRNTQVQTLRCNSSSRGRTYCGDAQGQYSLTGYRNQQCVEGRTYGQDNRGLWVSNGCSAVFERRDYDNRYGQGNAYGYGNGNGYGQNLRCESNSSGRTYCAEGRGQYTLHDTDNRNCVEGRTWGTDQRGLWVSNGCSAEFHRVSQYNDRNDSYPTDAYRNGTDDRYYDRD